MCEVSAFENHRVMGRAACDLWQKVLSGFGGPVFDDHAGIEERSHEFHGSLLGYLEVGPNF